MAELLLVGTTHYPPLIYPDEGMYSQLRKHVESDRTPAEMKVEANWPEAMQEEYGPNGANAQASAVGLGNLQLFGGLHYTCRADLVQVGQRHVRADRQPHG